MLQPLTIYTMCLLFQNDVVPLHLACQKGYDEVVKLLVGKNATTDAQTKV